ncbi:hypothetical protein [Kitasatospora purpeofusca]|uniref:hypothetical protein n=1 Tax=Kitasatospora purpeofusca TaxID=67352 RepID=UPI00381B5885
MSFSLHPHGRYIPSPRPTAADGRRIVAVVILIVVELLLVALIGMGESVSAAVTLLLAGGTVAGALRAQLS